MDQYNKKEKEEEKQSLLNSVEIEKPSYPPLESPSNNNTNNNAGIKTNPIVKDENFHIQELINLCGTWNGQEVFVTSKRFDSYCCGGITHDYYPFDISSTPNTTVEMYSETMDHALICRKMRYSEMEHDSRAKFMFLVKRLQAAMSYIEKNKEVMPLGYTIITRLYDTTNDHSVGVDTLLSETLQNPFNKHRNKYNVFNFMDHGQFYQMSKNLDAYMNQNKSPKCRIIGICSDVIHHEMFAKHVRDYRFRIFF